MDTSYDPNRIRDLRAHARAAVDELWSIRSDDPLAGEALRTIRLTTQNLEHCLESLQRIETSLAMVLWSDAAARLIDAGTAAMAQWLRHRERRSNAAVEQLLRALVSRPFDDGGEQLIRAARVTTVLAGLLDDPEACLDVLLEPGALVLLADWDELPDDVVEAFVVAGLGAAVAADPARLADGFQVLQTLTTHTNGHLDRGVTPGFARGVATSLAVYLPTLAPAIRHEGDQPVLVVDEARRVDVELGTYDDVVDLVGVLLRDERAQVALGVGLGTYARQVVDELGAELTERPGVAHVARFADVIADAARTEQVELVAAAEAAEGAKQRIGAAVIAVVDAGLSAADAGTGTRVFVREGLGVVVDQLARTEPDQLPDTSVPAATYDLISVATISMVAARPDVRHRVGLGSVSPQRWREVTARLDALAAETDPGERARAVIRLERWVATDVPELAGYLADVQASAGMEELTESRAAAAAD